MRQKFGVEEVRRDRVGAWFSVFLEKTLDLPRPFDEDDDGGNTQRDDHRALISTPYVDRQNRTTRMRMRRFTRPTNLRAVP